MAKRCRFKVHFTRTSASWLNLVEHRFSLLTEPQRGVEDQILDSVARFRQRTNDSGH
jgi:hypothetical protein